MAADYRPNRLHLAVALSVKNCTHPNRNNFVSFIRKVYAAKFNLSERERQTKEDIEILVKDYQTDRGHNFLANTPYLFTNEELSRWLATT